MVPTNSISQMMGIIDDENKVHTFSTEQLIEILYMLQHEDLTRIYDNNWNPLLTYFEGIIEPIVSEINMEKIVRLEDEVINELRNRGENPPMKKYS